MIMKQSNLHVIFSLIAYSNRRVKYLKKLVSPSRICECKVAKYAH
jgi:hypothetical protein